MSLPPCDLQVSGSKTDKTIDKIYQNHSKSSQKQNSYLCTELPRIKSFHEFFFANAPLQHTSKLKRLKSTASACLKMFSQQTTTFRYHLIICYANPLEMKLPACRIWNSRKSALLFVGRSCRIIMAGMAWCSNEGNGASRVLSQRLGGKYRTHIEAISDFKTYRNIDIGDTKIITYYSIFSISYL